MVEQSSATLARVSPRFNRELVGEAAYSVCDGDFHASLGKRGRVNTDRPSIQLGEPLLLRSDECLTEVIHFVLVELLQIRHGFSKLGVNLQVTATVSRCKLLDSESISFRFVKVDQAVQRVVSQLVDDVSSEAGGLGKFEPLRSEVGAPADDPIHHVPDPLQI